MFKKFYKILNMIKLNLKIIFIYNIYVSGIKIMQCYRRIIKWHHINIDKLIQIGKNYRILS